MPRPRSTVRVTSGSALHDGGKNDNVELSSGDRRFVHSNWRARATRPGIWIDIGIGWTGSLRGSQAPRHISGCGGEKNLCLRSFRI